MENNKSGMVTPPIVSPRPIQTQKPLSAEESWKIVGSPPRRPLLSPPEEREKSRVLQDNDITTVEGNRTKTLSGGDLVDLADSTTSSISAGTGSSSSSSASSNSTPASPTSPQHKQAPQRILTGQELVNEPLRSPVNPGAHHSASLFVQSSTSSFDQHPLADEPAPQHIHFKSSSTGTLSSKHLESTSFSLLGDHDVSLGDSYHTKSQSLGGLGTGAETTRGGMKQSSSGLDLPLNLSSFIWNRSSQNDTGTSSVTASSSNNSNHIDHTGPRSGRSLSFSDSGFPSAFGLSSAKLGLDQEDEDVLRYRPPLPTMEEEIDESNEPRLNRMRSFSTSAALGSSAFQGGLSNSMFSAPGQQDHFVLSGSSFSGSGMAVGTENRQPLHHKSSGGMSAWSNPISSEAQAPNHRRSVTSNSAYNTPIWESSGAFQPLSPTAERDSHIERQRIARRFSLAPASGFQNYDAFLDDVDAGNSSNIGSFNRHTLDNDFVQQAQRRHSVAGLGGSYSRQNIAPLTLTSSLESLQLNEASQTNNWSLYEEPYEEDEYQLQSPSAKELGKGLSLGQLPHCGSLYVVEFKAGRNDLFYIADNSGVSLKTGNLVIVEADRGKDLGKITNDSITPQQIQAMQAQQAEIAAMQAQQDGSGGSGGSGGGHRAPKEIHPKRIFRMAQPSEISLLVNKSQDEIKAMMVCQTKVRQKRLPMEVVDAEYQWDRRKLTFYFIAERRIDFRELVRDLFKIYKTRIWMYAVSPSMAAQSSSAGLHTSSPPLSVSQIQQQPQQQQPQQQQQQQQQQQLHQQHPQGSSVMTSPSVPRQHAEHPLSPTTPMSNYHNSQYPRQYQQPQHMQYNQYPQYTQIPLHLQQQHQQLQQQQQQYQHHQLQQSQQQLLSAHQRPPQSFYPLQPLPQPHSQQQQSQHPYSYSPLNS
ncbi:hypothetical protein BGX27_011368 [Mortierella sp. AM989]|nr:hypothetical protein BGX27_011368 [Mortierella sp. AM989]